ncbi:hypothetical protein V6N11_012512 [Hibiscus sabdariffa]|uniref:Uncharacterized protein n=1 Tax=Hibiscus sabdariffa TaxID=183260 RepID=A0ABR2QBB6_9ROSI
MVVETMKWPRQLHAIARKKGEHIYWEESAAVLGSGSKHPKAGSGNLEFNVDAAVEGCVGAAGIGGILGDHAGKF